MVLPCCGEARADVEGRVIAAVFTWITEGVEWSPTPYLSVGTLLALGGVVAVFGAMKSRTDDIPAWRKEMRDDVAAMRKEVRDEMAEMRKDTREDRASLREELGEIRDSVSELSNAVARLDGRRH